VTAKATNRPPVEIRLCSGGGCVSLGALDVLEAIRERTADSEVDVIVRSSARFVGCRGFCSQGPLVHFPRWDLLYCRVGIDDVDEILEQTVARGEKIDRLLYTDPMSGVRYRGVADNPFFANQTRLVLSRCGNVDPEDIGDAMALGAYDALASVLTDADGGRVIDLVKRSGLQERGGAGFPVGLKWSVVAETPGDRKYVVGNGESGDPGLTADRTLLEGDPHAIIEGMVIAGFAVGAGAGRLFLRSEHRLGVARAERAVVQARRRGCVGAGILGTDFDFEIEICENAGASMGGEETAILNAIQGRRGVARPRPPFPAVSGLWGCPTLINSLETLANVPLIVGGGQVDDDNGPGRTKIVGLSGSVVRAGVAEVALGTPIREVVDRIGGGCSDGRIRAIHLGGVGGTTLGTDRLDTPIEFGAVHPNGTCLGSAGVVVLGEHDCPVELARHLVACCADESCGTCPPCRIGTHVMLEILDRFADGSAEEADLGRLERLCGHVARTSMCELGRRASASVLASLVHCGSDYRAHLGGRGCPVGNPVTAEADRTV
jgi:NADH-quinone oxidoreductase subunit F